MIDEHEVDEADAIYVAPTASRPKVHDPLVRMTDPATGEPVLIEWALPSVPGGA